MNKFIIPVFLSFLLYGCGSRPSVYNNGDFVYVQVLAEKGQVIRHDWSISNETWEYLVKSKSCPDGCNYLEFQLSPDMHIGYAH